jgi:ABC-type glycerol-3-phosphate transport system substrate-binding protein
MKHHPVRLTALGLTLLLALGACGSGGDSNSSDSAATTVTTTAAGAAAGTGATGKVDANKASVAELQAAFEAAGISNAAKWAREVEEYRPYPTDDPSFAKLRSELAKYNPSPEVLTKIVAALSL